MSARGDLVPLSERLAALQVVRVVMAAVVVSVAVVAPDLAAADVDLVALSAVYLAATASVEGIRRTARRRAIVVVSGMLLVDGLYLAAVVAETGGVTSHLLFLVHLHLVATAVLASFRSGLVVAGWQVLLLISGELAPWVGAAPARPTAAHVVVGASFFLVASTGIAVASLNEAALRRSRRSATTLVELGSALERCRSAEQVSAVAAQQLAAVPGARRAAVLIADGDDWRGAVADECSSVSVVVPPGTGDRRPVEELSLVDHLDPVADRRLAAVLPGACHVVVAPIVSDDVCTGVVAIEFGPARTVLTAEQRSLLSRSVDRIGLSIRAVSLLAEVERLATSDGLTGLPNRRLFDATLAREVARARRTGSPLSLGLIDVDHFKAVNDDHGHQVGDEVLRELAGLLRSATRGEDLVARYGGEEFVVLMVDAPASAAVRLGERLRTAAGAVRSVPVTISVGVASLGPEGTGESLVADADAALYRAKASGRNRTVQHGVDDVPVVASV